MKLDQAVETPAVPQDQRTPTAVLHKILFFGGGGFLSMEIGDLQRGIWNDLYGILL